MYYQILSNHPEINYTLYYIYIVSIFVSLRSLCFIINWKILDLESEEENMSK